MSKAMNPLMQTATVPSPVLRIYCRQRSGFETATHHALIPQVTKASCNETNLVWSEIERFISYGKSDIWHA